MDEKLILNKGLEFALEFGPNWLQPLQSRLSDKFPALTPDQLDKFDSICRKTRDDGNRYLFQILETTAQEKKKIRMQDLTAKLNSLLLDSCPWIDEENLKRILNQGMYYAWKEGLSEFVLD